MKKERLDRLLVNRSLVGSRNKAFAVIVAGEVKVNGVVCLKPDFLVDDAAEIQYGHSDLNYVSRGGQKLAGALEDFGIDVAGKVALDAGSSTGGFTDCLLKHGAAKVIAVDVGYGQIDWRLRQEPRVDLHERVNLRYLGPGDISEPADLATLDLSFISLTKVMSAVIACLKPEGEVLALVKPQFEAGKGKVGRSGVIRDPGLHREILTGLGRHLIDSGLSMLNIDWSRLTGAKGNIEFWFYLSKKAYVGYSIEVFEKLVDHAVAGAHAELAKGTKSRSRIDK